MSYGFKKLFKFKCSECKKERSTLKEKIAKIGICQKCKRVEVSKNQTSIYDFIKTKKPYVKNS